MIRSRPILTRRLIQCAVLLILGLWASALPTPAAAQSSCGPQSQQSGTHCKSPTATPWRYLSDLPAVGTHPSMGDLTSAMIAFMMGTAGPPKCSVTLDSLVPQGGTGYAWPTVAWSDISHDFSGTFTTVWTNLNPCDVSQTTGVGIHQQRNFLCPAGYTALVSGGNAFCAMDWWRADPKKPCGSCAGGEGDVNVGGATGGGGATGQGDAGLGSGNNHVQQNDYGSSGSSSLAVQRHYNSNHVINYSSIPLAIPPFGPGWSAKYFQRIEHLGAGAFDGATVHRPDGQTLQFDASGTSFVAPPDIEDRLVAQRDVSNNIIGWTYTLSNDTVETYDANGRLQSIAYRGGTTDTLVYGSGGSPITVTDSFGNQLIYTLSGGQVSQVQNSAGQTFSYQYTDTKLTRVTYPDTTYRQYHYSGYFLTGITDESNTRYTTYTYDGSTGRLATTELAGGVNKYTLSADTFYRYVTDPLGTQRTYFFDATALHHIFRQRAAYTYSNGISAPKTVTYDANANVASRKDFNNNITTYSYDLTRNLETSRTEAYGTAKARTITTAWHSTLSLPTSITEPNRTTSFTYDGAGRVLTRTITDTSVTPNVARTWTYTYNSFGRVLTEDGPRTDVSDVTTYTYYNCTTGYQCGQLNTITNAAGHVTTFNAYDVHGQPTQTTDPNGLVSTLAYDNRQRLTDRCVGSYLPACSGGELTHLV
jgi:YD repeat-containing protein